MKKSFTLIELIVSIAILAVIAAASIPALFIHQKRAQLDEATTQLKDAILSTQNFAFAPNDKDAQYYSIIITTGSPASFWISCMGCQNTSISSGTLSDKVTVSSNLPNNGIDFRVSDKVVGFGGQFNNLSGSSQITLTEAGASRIITIQNTTGVVSVENQ